METRARAAFKAHFQELREQLALTARGAAEIAQGVTTGLYSEIFGQIDPMRLGEIERAVRICWEYGSRLSKASKNVKEGTLERLVAGYPSHGFVIDREEASELFVHVREPSMAEQAFLESFGVLTRGLDKKPNAAIFYVEEFLNDGRPGNEAVGTAPSEDPGGTVAPVGGAGGTNGEPEPAVPEPCAPSPDGAGTPTPAG